MKNELFLKKITSSDIGNFVKSANLLKHKYLSNFSLEDKEDLSQETYLALLSYVGTEYRSLRSRLYSLSKGILLNKIRYLYRERMNKNRIERDNTTAILYNMYGGTFMEEELKDRRRMVIEMLEVLTEDESYTLIRSMEGFTGKETAEAMEVSQSKITRILKSALTQMREEVKNRRY